MDYQSYNVFNYYNTNYTLIGAGYVGCGSAFALALDAAIELRAELNAAPGTAAVVSDV
jgi:hypothetical protein